MWAWVRVWVLAQRIVVCALRLFIGECVSKTHSEQTQKTQSKVTIKKSYDCIFCVLCGHSSVCSAVKGQGTQSANAVTILQGGIFIDSQMLPSTQLLNSSSTPLLMTCKGQRNGRFLNGERRRCKTGEGFEFTDKVGLVEIAAVVRNVGEG